MMSEQPAESSTPAIRPGVSLTMIVKNEEQNIATCLESVHDLVDEIIVVDTGSTDATKSIAASLGARVFDFPWVDDFAAARNESIRHATRQWVFCLDADDRLDEENRARLRALFSQLPAGNVAYLMKLLCYPSPPVTKVQLFRNDPRVRWKYRCGEQICHAVRESGGELRWSDVVILHTGYHNPTHLSAKAERNLRCYRLENREHPNDPHVLAGIGVQLQNLGQWAEALPYLQESLALSDSTQSCNRYCRAIIAGCHIQLGQIEQALQVCREGLREFPNDADLLEKEQWLTSAMMWPTYVVSMT
jgi:glycosyltransferase involved in cell wall biosynthesis